MATPARANSAPCTSRRFRPVCLPCHSRPPRPRPELRVTRICCTCCTHLLLQGEPLLRHPRAHTRQHDSRRNVHLAIAARWSVLTGISVPKSPSKLHAQSDHQRIRLREAEGGSNTTPAVVLGARSSIAAPCPHRHHLSRPDRGTPQRRRGQGELQGPQEQARLHAPGRHHRICPPIAGKLPQHPRRHVCPHPQSKYNSTRGFSYSLYPTRRMTIY